MKTIHLLLCLLLASSLFLLFKKINWAPQQNRENIFVVGTSPDYPPYSFFSKQHEIVGFDIDIAREIAHRLNKKIVIKDMPFHSLIFELFAQNIDIIAAGMTPTERKSKKVSFSHTYLEGDALVVVTKQNSPDIITVEALKNKKIAVNLGYTADLYLSDKDNVDLIRLETPADCFMALSSGTVDAFVAAKSSIATFLATQKNNIFKIHTLPDTGESYALVINKHNDELLKKINTIIDTIKKDGTLHALKQKWNLL